MRILFVGDVVGQPGVTFLQEALAPLRRRDGIDLVVANAENAAGGSGLTPSIYKKLRQAGVDLFTLGDHIYKKREIITVLDKDERTCKPANFPPGAPGRLYAETTMPDGTVVAVCSVLGRTFMRPVDCPFHAVDRVLTDLAGRARVIVVDVHAEATADKYLLAHHLKGRVAAVLGTHTHVPTADEQILPGGTAFQCDVGMTGPYHSVLGRKIDRVLTTAVSFIPTTFDVAEGDRRLGGAVVEVDVPTGKATAIRRVMLDERDLAGLKAEFGPAG